MPSRSSSPIDTPEPAALLHAFSRHHPVSWGDPLPSAAEIAALHSTRATTRSLRLLERAVGAEPKVTADFLAALPDDGSAYRLDSRIKSPTSLARKLEDARQKGRQRMPEDVLRYTVLVKSPEQLVAAARHTVDELCRSGWQVGYAMQSYTDGSRYKGLHAYLEAHGIDSVEVQFHSVASVQVKEATTKWYEIERSALRTSEERTAARANCVQLSATLPPPSDIEDLTALGGRTVAVRNYSDSRESGGQTAAVGSTAPANTRHATTIKRDDGIKR
jgi:hypothetical protein